MKDRGNPAKLVTPIVPLAMADAKQASMHTYPYFINDRAKRCTTHFYSSASDDELHLVPMSISLYSAWLAAGHSAEILIYSKGRHGFGMNKRRQPSDTWIGRFGDLLQAQGLLNK